MDIALKEWHCVCNWLTQGRQALLLRKGGIHEETGPGVFQMEHDRFLLFPSWAHQKPELLKPDFAAGVAPLAEPPRVTLRAWAETASIQVVPSRESLDALHALHCWNSAYLDMRWGYKQDRPLYAIVLRVFELATPLEMENGPAYAGCRSWVPLEPRDVLPSQAVEASTQVMDDQTLAALQDRVESALAH